MRRTCVLLVFLVGFSLAASSQVLTTLADFNGSNGSSPSAALVLGTDGNFYGTTATGGDFNVGTVFKVTPAGILTTLHSFNGADGDQPLASLVQATDGNFYGTTASGGGSGFGTVFKITSNGTFTNLYSFTAADGQTPYGGLVQDSSGDLFGTTSTDPLNHAGTIFKVTTQGVVTILHVFNGQDGSMPHAGLALAADGSFYGTTEMGGAHNYGTVFKVTSDGTLTTLYSFNNADGAYPLARLLLASDGNFYGTTSQGGPSHVGNIFRITPAGSLTVLHNFAVDGDGWTPNGLVQATDGLLYGTTAAYGDDQSCGGFCGTIFQLTLDGTLVTEYRFGGKEDGYSPQAGLTVANDESFYGTALGGADKDGTVFRIVVHANLSVAKSGMGTIISGDGYINCGNFCSHTYPGGTQVGLTANPAAGYTFSSWDGCDNPNGNFCSLTMSGGKDVIATFDVAGTTLNSLSFKSPSVKGGNIAIATVMLNAPAPPGGLGVAMSSDQPLIVHPPSMIVIPGGVSSYSFAVRTSPVRVTTVANVMASTGSSQVSATLTVTPGYNSSQQKVVSQGISSR